MNPLNDKCAEADWLLEPLSPAWPVPLCAYRVGRVLVRLRYHLCQQCLLALSAQFGPSEVLPVDDDPQTADDAVPSGFQGKSATKSEIKQFGFGESVSLRNSGDTTRRPPSAVVTGKSYLVRLASGEARLADRCKTELLCALSNVTTEPAIRAARAAFRGAAKRFSANTIKEIYDKSIDDLTFAEYNEVDSTAHEEAIEQLIDRPIMDEIRLICGKAFSDYDSWIKIGDALESVLSPQRVSCSLMHDGFRLACDPVKQEQRGTARTVQPRVHAPHTRNEHNEAVRLAVVSIPPGHLRIRRRELDVLQYALSREFPEQQVSTVTRTADVSMATSARAKDVLEFVAEVHSFIEGEIRVRAAGREQFSISGGTTELPLKLVRDSGGAVKTKRSTESGEGQIKLKAALTKHHQYANGSRLNLEPVGNNQLARLAEVDKATASDFFKRQFNGHGKYKALCADASGLAAALKMLNGEFAPHLLYGSRPPDNGERDEE